ncbi:MAG: glucose-6-phosphate dehydrogenase, partial [Kiritimatiellae bacterium]|nr:glucose-6-phosphate dehydrogenase [Kiritimatiellia bacterium]
MSSASSEPSEFLAVVILGASGDLAQRKIYPALFALYCQGFLPASFKVYGYARSTFSPEEWGERILSRLTCRDTPAADCAAHMQSFMEHGVYRSGSYSEPSGFVAMREEIQRDAGGRLVHVLLYFALPSTVFPEAANMIGRAGWTGGPGFTGWMRCVMEKPFGRDLESFRRLTDELSGNFQESQIYRIDHYLGKEVVQNLLVLRFGNLIFEPFWNRHYVERIELSWYEDMGVGERGAYFDRYGIVRDVMQNHLLQMAALIGMEHPREVPGGVRDEKVKLLKSFSTALSEHCVLGQYEAGMLNGERHSAYTDEASVEVDSHTATYAECVLWANNARWAGVPFVLRAGKGCGERKTEIQLVFRETALNPFAGESGALGSNRLVIRVQPDEKIYLRVNTKRPGLAWTIDEQDLQLHYQSVFSEQIPDAYEALLLEVLKGDRSLFLRSDELEASWAIFTPLLHAMDENRVVVEKYAFGSMGPTGIF